MYIGHYTGSPSQRKIMLWLPICLASVTVAIGSVLFMGLRFNPQWLFPCWFFGWLFGPTIIYALWVKISPKTIWTGRDWQFWVGLSVLIFYSLALVVGIYLHKH